MAAFEKNGQGASIRTSKTAHVWQGVGLALEAMKENMGEVVEIAGKLISGAQTLLLEGTEIITLQNWCMI